MPTSLRILVGCQLICEVPRRTLHLPLPGPVIGMVLLAAALAIGDNGRAGGIDDDAPLARTANGLIANMGLLFVPAGVGVIVEFDLLRPKFAANSGWPFPLDDHWADRAGIWYRAGRAASLSRLPIGQSRSDRDPARRGIARMHGHNFLLGPATVALAVPLVRNLN